MYGLTFTHRVCDAYLCRQGERISLTFLYYDCNKILHGRIERPPQYHRVFKKSIFNSAASQFHVEFAFFFFFSTIFRRQNHLFECFSRKGMKINLLFDFPQRKYLRCSSQRVAQPQALLSDGLTYPRMKVVCTKKASESTALPLRSVHSLKSSQRTELCILVVVTAERVGADDIVFTGP